MLLNFKCNNFKSFRDGFEFNMHPVSRFTDHRDSLLTESCNKSQVDALSTSVIYGPNAAGKTSVINAMSCFKQIVLRGNIENMENDRISDHVSHNLKLIPFFHSSTTKPVTFEAEFISNGHIFRYNLEFIVNNLLDDNDSRRITSEELYFDNKCVYLRLEKTVAKMNVDFIKDYFNIGVDFADIDRFKEIMSNNLDSTKLLLNTDFYSLISKTIADLVINWFKDDFKIINSSESKTFFPATGLDSDRLFIESTINNIAREAGIVGTDFAYSKNPDNNKPQLISILKYNDDLRAICVDARLIESLGTLRLIGIMPGILTALSSGTTLVIDELDTSLHPMMVMSLVSLFHNNEVNVKHAQLIFNTHNPIFLDNRLLRRDEIKFVEKDKDTKTSELYSLSDFKANGDGRVRKTTDYMKNYFVNRYGAIENIDFTDIVKQIISEEN